MWAMKSNLHRHRRSCGGNTEKAVEESSWVGGLLNTQVERKAVQGLLRLVEAERRGEPIEGVLLSRLLRALGSLGMYATSFEVPFLEETAAFYATEGCAVMASADVAEYLIHCEVNAFLLPGRLSPRTKPWLCLLGGGSNSSSFDMLVHLLRPGYPGPVVSSPTLKMCPHKQRRLGEEFTRCTQYLDPSTRKPLVAQVERQLLEVHMPVILERHVSACSRLPFWRHLSPGEECL